MYDDLITNDNMHLVKKGLLNRPRVDILLKKSMEYPVVTITAGSGYGKTQAVSMFLNDTNTRTAWIQLTRLDNHEMVFWRKFLNEVLFFDKDTAVYLESLGFPNTPSKFEKFIYILAKKIYSNEQFVLVIDDFYLLSDETIINFVQNLIYTKFENLCIVLISRTKINLDISGIYINGVGGHISMDDLRFTIDEIEEYFRLQGHMVSKQDLVKIKSFTEGWPLALYLVSLSIKNGYMVYGDPINCAMSLIFEMIEREIFSLYTTEIRQILIKISLLESFPLELIKELSGDQFNTVVEVLNTNMFARYDIHLEHYYFHQLFLDFVAKKQVFLDDSEISEIYLISGDWFYNHDRKISALTCYKKCKCYEKIWDTIYNIQPERRPKKITDFLIELIDEFPKEFIKKHPMARVLRASYLLNNMKLDIAADDLLNLIEELEATQETRDNKAVAGETYIILGLIHLTLRNYKFITFFKKANEYLPNGSVFNYSNIKIIDSNDAIIPHSPDRKDINEMLEALFETVPYISKVTHGLGQGAEYLAAAEVAYFTGDFRKAEGHAFQAIYKAKQKTQIDIVCSSYFLMMRVASAKGEYNETIEYMKQLREYVESSPDRAFFSILDIAESWFYVKVGMSDKTAAWILDDNINEKVQSPISVGRDRYMKSYCLLERGRYYELLAYIDQLDELYYQRGLLFEIIFSNVFKMIALFEVGEQTHWINALHMAYEISCKSNFIMQFIEMGSYTRKIIDCARKLDNHNIPKDWLNNVYSKTSTYAKRQSYFKSKYEKEQKVDNINDIGLTKRESEVLKDLCQGLTREEIAGSLYLSVGTVKNVLNSIYSKLGALNNKDAVRIAMQMQII